MRGVDCWEVSDADAKCVSHKTRRATFDSLLDHPGYQKH
jgi:hypothetical protein